MKNTLKEYAEFETSPELINQFVGKTSREARRNMDQFVSEHFKAWPSVGRIEKGYAAAAFS